MKSYPAFQKLQKYFTEFKDIKITELFEDSKRIKQFTFQEHELTLDLSKNLITKEVIDLFIKLAQEIKIEDSIQAMFSGQPINFTEKRAVLHTALRNPNVKASGLEDSQDAKEIYESKQKFFDFVNKVRSGIITGSTNKPFKYIVNIGIGGSYLGTQMAYNALKDFDDSNLLVYFVSNVDAANLIDILKKINLEETLFVIASKTFTTQETMMNAETAKNYLINKLGKQAQTKHFVALSTNIEEVTNFGINPDWIFGFWDFIGGRYSIWSSIGLPLALKIGSKNFQEFLNGANLIDTHFQRTPLTENMPFLLAIISIWYNNFFKYNSYAIIAYDYRMRDFTRYIQQLEMESNGKSVNKLGHRVTYNTSPVVFGEPGTDSQHSFFQMIHQGTNIIPCDFIGFIKPHHHYPQHHLALIANMFAQSEALMVGKTEQVAIEEMDTSIYSEEEITLIAPHRVFEGNRPSNTFLFESLTPKTLGMLCALYEHKIFVQGLFWEINSFDQWGVELGKKLAKNIIHDITVEVGLNTTNASTLNLIDIYKKYQSK
ncbi:Glucose-6-phosphate isomerase [Candidatus Hepatincola sp. Pdp]